MQTEQLPRLEAGEYPGGIWYYEPHTYLPYRYVLGRVGRHPLVCIGINPSTAQPGALDPTLKSVERLANANGFDSWIMFNVYPQRATNPNDMDKTPDRALCDENLRWLPAVPFACYPVLLVLLNVRWFRLLSANRAAALDFMQLIARAVFVPAFVFLGGTLLRARLNFPRPYEQPGFTPLVPKETHGKSFPSRHALSAAVLAAVWCYFYPAAGACMVVVALLICALRVLAGAHYVRDVAAGALLGFALGAAGMYLL